MFTTLNVKQAAKFLNINDEVCRRNARAGIIPGCKMGQKWIFILEDLVEYLRSQYKGDVCYTKETKQETGIQSSRSAEKELDAVLKRKIKR